MIEAINRAADAALAVYPDETPPSWPEARLVLRTTPLRPQIMISPEGRSYVAIQGTHELEHWLTNLSAWRRGWRRWRVHAGFADAADPIARDLEWYVDTIFMHRPIITGHSLGGVVALMVAAALPCPCDVIAFGMPKSGAGPELAKAAGGRVLRIQNGSDAVPRRPFWRRYDGGQLLYIDNDDYLIANPSIWHRFKDRAFMLAQWEQITDHSMTGYRAEITDRDLPDGLW